MTRETQHLDQSHPSFGTKSAAFLFRRHDGSLVLVEAHTPAAVATIELVLGYGGGYAAPGLANVAVFRDFREVGLRLGAVDEVRYIDFVTEMIDPGLVTGNARAAAAFAASVTPEDRAYVLGKGERPAPALPPAGMPAPPPPPPPEMPAPPTGRQMLETALSSMGFQRGLVQKYVSSLGPKVEHAPIELLLRDGISHLDRASRIR